MRIVHLDLRPVNIMIKDVEAQEFNFKLIDFNLSQKFPFKVESGINQTPSICAPENFVGRKYDESADIWSLGVTICQVILNDNVFYSKYNKGREHVVSTNFDHLEKDDIFCNLHFELGFKI